MPSKLGDVCLKSELMWRHFVFWKFKTLILNVNQKQISVNSRLIGVLFQILLGRRRVPPPTLMVLFHKSTADYNTLSNSIALFPRARWLWGPLKWASFTNELFQWRSLYVWLILQILYFHLWHPWNCNNPNIAWFFCCYVWSIMLPSACLFVSENPTRT